MTRRGGGQLLQMPGFNGIAKYDSHRQIVARRGCPIPLEATFPSLRAFAPVRCRSSIVIGASGLRDRSVGFQVPHPVLPLLDFRSLGPL
jgi:hypothetical protein